MITPTSTTNTSASSSASTAKNMNEAQDRFLKLLVSQMKNQNPLNPLDNAQVTSQMAQISTVTGIGQLNDTISGFLDKLNGLQSMQGAGLAGHGVLVSGNSLELTASGATAGMELTTAAERVTLVVKDSAGRTVARNELGAKQPGIHTIRWDGLTTTGERAADGRYTFSIEASAAGSAVAATTLAHARVNGVTPSNGGLLLDLGALGVRAYGDVKQFQ